MYKRSENNILKHFDFILLDMLALMAALLSAYGIYNRALLNLTMRSLYTDCLVVIEVMALMWALLIRPHKSILRRNEAEEFFRTLIYVSLVSAGLLVFLFFSKNVAALSRLTIGYFFVLAVGTVFIVRVLWKNLLRSRLKTADKRKLLLVSTRQEAVELLKKITERGLLDFEIEGIMLLDGGKATIQDIPVVSSAEEDTVTYLSNHVIDGVLFTLSEDGTLPHELMNQCEEMGLTVHIALPMMENLYGVQTAEKLGGIPTISSSLRIVYGWEAAAKRLMDIVCGLVGTILAGIILIFVAPAIYISDPGPIFFKQTRIGKSGRPFTIYKIRSMYQDAEERKQALMAKNQMSGFMFKMENDPRIIGSGPNGTKHGIGWWIRTLSLDEFPQFALL